MRLLEAPRLERAEGSFAGSEPDAARAAVRPPAATGRPRRVPTASCGPPLPLHRQRDALRHRQALGGAGGGPDLGVVLDLLVHPDGAGEGDLDLQLAVRGRRPAGLGAPELEQADLPGGPRLDGFEIEPVLV